MKNKYYDLHYVVIKNRDDKGIVDDKVEDSEKDYINFTDIITPNHYIGIKRHIVMLR